MKPGHTTAEIADIMGIPTRTEAKKIISEMGAPTFAGDVARIYHPEGASFCISTSRRSIIGMPDQNWEKKIDDTKMSRLVILSKKERFDKLFVPQVYWVDKPQVLAAVEWVDGVNLNATPDNTLYRALADRARGMLEYIRFLQLNHSKGNVIADHKPSSLVGEYQYLKGWKFGLVDVSLVKPETGTMPSDEKALWGIELGKGGANNVNGGDLDKTLLSFYKFGLAESIVLDTHKFVVPGAVQKFVRKLPSYRSASEAGNEFSAWLNQEPTRLDYSKAELESILELPMVSKESKAHKVRAVQSDISNILHNTISGDHKYSDLEISKALFFLNEIVYEDQRNHK